MYLKSIRAQGFKSFADKLDLEINPGITGIVGPNGSGKSNIVDAVRWVLGEQSVRSLRGQNNMTDCIFSGSESREAQKRAMVALVFDNSDHYLHSDFKEVEIKRIVYSTGENEYYINNSRVRLKDITDMFIDSGAGANAFNIISQGNVTDIVNSKSSDRRVIFESAAGVLKYKKRKEESLKKLERTEENLMRIKLVIDELSKTVLPLKEQSVVAKKYLDIKGELESIDVALIAKDITDLNLEYSKVSEEVKALKEKLITLKDNVGYTRLEKLRLRNIELEEVVNKKKEELLKITEDISNLNGEKKLTLERKKYEASKEVIDDNLIKLKESELNVNKNITVLEREILDIEASVNDQREKSEEVKTQIEQFENVNNIEMRDKTIQALINVANGIRWVSGGILILLIVISIFIIANTIKLTVHARRKEISIMKYVGATNSFIRWPFIVEGMIIGIIAAMISILILGVAYNLLTDKILQSAINSMINIQLLSFSEIFTLVIAVYLTLGIGIGIIGSMISMRKYLEV